MRTIQMCALVLGAALIAPGCAKDSNKQSDDSQTRDVAAASRPIAEPGPIMATVQLPDGEKLSALAKAVDAYQPGGSAMLKGALGKLLTEATGVDMAGANLAASVSIVLVSPKEHAQPVAVLVKVADQKALTASAQSAGAAIEIQAGIALIGDAAVVAAVKDAAFGGLARPAQTMVVRFYSKPLLETYRAEVQQAFARMTEMAAQQQPGSTAIATVFEVYERGAIAIAEQADVVELRVANGDGTADLLIRMRPRAGTTLAAFARAQVASKYDLVGRLPAMATSGILFAGELHAGEAHDALVDAFAPMMSALIPGEPPDRMKQLMEGWLGVLDGRNAASIGMDMSNPLAPKMTMTSIIGSRDADKTRTLWRDWMTKFATGSKEVAGMTMNVTFEPKVKVVGGIEVDRYVTKVDLARFPEEQREAMAAMSNQTMHFAVLDDVAIMQMSTQGDTTIEDAIGAVRGKAPVYRPAGAVAEALARSRKLGESCVFLFDVRALVPTGAPTPFSAMSMGMGQDSGDLTFRVSVSK